MTLFTHEKRILPVDGLEQGKDKQEPARARAIRGKGKQEVEQAQEQV